MEYGPRMLAALHNEKTIIRDRLPDVPLDIEPPPADTNPIVFVSLHGTKYVRGAKIVTPGTIRPPTWRQRLRAAIAFPATNMRRAYLFLRAIYGGGTTEDQYADRMEVCGTCPKRIVVPVVRGGQVVEKSYCGPCNCPRWYYSRLDVKNHMAGWKCPLRLHEGPYPDDTVRAWILDKGYATVDQLEADGSNCRGCG